MDLMAIAYPWLKWLHFLALISWMAGLFYLPRLFVYHAETTEPKVHETLEVMEYKLQKFIMTPAMLVTWVTGLLLAFSGIVAIGGWLVAKVLLVLAMTGFHGVCGKWRKALAAGTSAKSGRYFRVANEVPTVLLVLIVGLVVFKPF